MTIQHDGPPTTPPVVYVSDQEPGEVYLNFGNHQSFARHKMTMGEVDKLLKQLLSARLRWPVPDRTDASSCRCGAVTQKD